MLVFATSSFTSYYKRAISENQPYSGGMGRGIFTLGNTSRILKSTLILMQSKNYLLILIYMEGSLIFVQLGLILWEEL